MKIIDCNGNLELRDDLLDILHKHNHDVETESDRIYIKKEITSFDIESFLKKTGRPKHRAFLIDNDRFLVVIPQDLRDIGMDYCEFCGYIGYPEDIDVHRRSHQAL